MNQSNRNVLSAASTSSAIITHPAVKRRRNLTESDENTAPNDELNTNTSASSTASSREVSLIEVSLISSRTRSTLDGRINAQSQKYADRSKLEKESWFLYQYPRSTGRGSSSKNNKLLELMLNGEVDGGTFDSGQEFTINSILSIDVNAVLINWEGYKYPTWVPKQDIAKRSGTAYKDFNLRLRILDPLYKYLGKKGRSFIYTHYPNNMPLKKSIGFGEDDAHHLGLLYQSGLRKRERQINELIAERDGRSSDDSDDGQMIIFEDWTDNQNSYIPNFEFITENELTDDVKAIEADLMVNDQSCACTERCDGESNCCAHKATSQIAYITDNHVGNLVRCTDDDLGTIEKSPDCVDMYECGDSCACDVDKCMQRAMQKGHNNKLIVFMHHERGWTMHAGNDLKRGAFVCEYVGVMMTAKEALRKADTMYQIDLDVKTKGGKSRKLVMDALQKGNAGRFFAHSCEPNLFSYRVHYDITGRSKRHIGLFACRDIEAGEELTFDYHPDITDPVEFHNRAEFACKCGAANCREKAYKALMRGKAIKVEEIE